MLIKIDMWGFYDRDCRSFGLTLNGGDNDKRFGYDESYDGEICGKMLLFYSLEAVNLFVNLVQEKISF